MYIHITTGSDIGYVALISMVIRGHLRSLEINGRQTLPNTFRDAISGLAMPQGRPKNISLTQMIQSKSKQIQSARTLMY